MGKKSAKSKKPKTSVKIQNKSINKLNRRKKNKPKSNKLKEIRNATKVRFDGFSCILRKFKRNSYYVYIYQN